MASHAAQAAKSVIPEFWKRISSVTGRLFSIRVIGVILVSLFVVSSQAHTLTPWDIVRTVTRASTFIWCLTACISHLSDEFSADSPKMDFGKFRPMFFLCWTIHARFIPTQYKFKYPLFYVGFPVSLRGRVRGPLFSILPPQGSSERRHKLSLFTVDPARFFLPTLPFNEKVNVLLRQRGLNPEDYPFVYFVTTPQFLGYAFNPVSYYYLYDAQKKLQATILEVNNTFGEAHIYILQANDPRNPAPRQGYDFAGSMEKIFHISPFNNRSGSYTIQVRDPLRDEGRHDVNMTVYNEEGVKTMMARAFSTVTAFDILNGSLWLGFYIALAWGYTTFLAIPQTFFQAWKIFRRGTKVYTRPEPTRDSGKRKATVPELRMQVLFIQYLQHKIDTFSTSVRVVVTLPQCNICQPQVNMVIEKTNHDDSVPLRLDLEILNYKFFHRFFFHSSFIEMLHQDFVLTPSEHRSFDVNSRKLWEQLLCPQLSPASCPLGRVISQLRSGKLSDMDAFFMRSHRRLLYTRSLVDAFLINQVALGEAVYFELLQRVSLWLFSLTAVAIYFFI